MVAAARLSSLSACYAAVWFPVPDMEINVQEKAVGVSLWHQENCSSYMQSYRIRISPLKTFSLVWTEISHVIICSAEVNMNLGCGVRS